MSKLRARSDFRIEICQNRPDKNPKFLEILDTASKGTFRGPAAYSKKQDLRNKNKDPDSDRVSRRLVESFSFSKNLTTLAPSGSLGYSKYGLDAAKFWEVDGDESL